MQPIQRHMRKISLDSDVDIYEQAPGYRTVKIDMGNAYHLYFPYFIYIVRRDSKSRKYPRPVPTLHIGLRTEPLPSGVPLVEQILLYPPLPNIYNKWLLTCCRGDIESFWGDPFNSAGWPCYGLMSFTALQDFDNWQMMSPDMVMEAFKEWPEYIPFTDDPSYPEHEGLGGHVPGFDPYNEYGKKGKKLKAKDYEGYGKLYTKLFIAEALAELPMSAVHHIEDVSGRYGGY